MSLDTRRHDTLFDKQAFTEEVHLIGLGGVGSAIARQLAKLGVGTKSVLHLWDGDTVDVHNPANQAYDLPDVGMKKAHVLVQHVDTWSSGTVAHAHPVFVTERVPLTGVVFLCLDTMQARKEICEASLWNNKNVSLVIETRMDASHVIIHAFDPNDLKHIEYWNMYWYPDTDTENEAGCGGHVSVISTVEITASMAVQQFIHYCRSSDVDTLYNQVQCNLRSWEIKKATWQTPRSILST